MANIDERLLAAQLADQQRQARLAEEDKKGQVDAGEADRGRQGEAGQADGQSGSLRERWRAAKRAMDLKQKAKDKLEEKVAAPASKLSTKFLNFIPSYGPYVAFKRFIAGKKSKFNLVDIIIMLFSNLTACFMVLAVLAFIALIVTWATNPLTAVKAIMDLGWGAVSALVNLFKGLLSVK